MAAARKLEAHDLTVQPFFFVLFCFVFCFSLPFAANGKEKGEGGLVLQLRGPPLSGADA